MTNLTQVKNSIIQPVLDTLPSALTSPAALNLLAYTFLAESGGGEYVTQLGGGPALGPFQMEPATHDDCWRNYLDYEPVLADAGRRLACGSAPTAQQLAGNWLYAAFMCRIKYARSPLSLPAANDAAGLVAYWKQIYNSALGAGAADTAHAALAEQAIAA